MNTIYLPTDKYGNVYRGPKTYKEAVEAIFDYEADPKCVADMMERAGYNRIAARIRKEWKESIEN